MCISYGEKIAVDQLMSGLEITKNKRMGNMHIFGVKKLGWNEQCVVYEAINETKHLNA